MERKLTQLDMADELGISQAGYGKIERDLTDISIGRLSQIAKILDVDYRSILDFDEKTIINMYNNHNANAIVQNQQNINENGLADKLDKLFSEIQSLKSSIVK